MTIPVAPTVPMTCLGLDLFTARPIEGRPIDCFVIARVLVEDGIDVHLLTTDDLDTMTCLGMQVHGLASILTAMMKVSE
jgi:hypothetical protein